ncbi:acyl-CoA dehydrogenase family protein [Indioceanicola profundi]|uniref:acyl-CoA dehydrogenase family protein n=1 Tax=Indioceanicola profundi TaxID=2220096 RepID=UPI000E6ADC47|nr:acyl-CoA dehydrogenase family protein [Indioceanicola profundi]
MDLNYTADELAFAEEVRQWVRANLPPETRHRVLHHIRLEKQDFVNWQAKLAERGWGAPAWPEQYGGTRWTSVQKHLFEEILAEEGAPPAIPFGLGMIGPVLIAFGSEAQKQRYLPRILTMEDWWCQGFSEPGSGSDLASLRTRAVLDGDEWVITGQKTWTTMAQHANMIFVLARTDPAAKPQKGISMFLMDMATPGVTVRPIITIDGEHEVNEVFFDDVRIPKDAIVGEPGKGWTYAKFLLSHERTGIARIGRSKAELKRLKHIASEETVEGVPLIRTPGFAAKIAALEIELTALELTNLRMIAAEKAGQAPGVEANMLKIKGSEIQQTLTELMMEAVGPYALPFNPEAREPGWNGEPIGPDYAAPLAPDYFNYRKVTIYGGSNEIQRNILAKAKLGL